MSTFGVTSGMVAARYLNASDVGDVNAAIIAVGAEVTSLLKYARKDGTEAADGAIAGLSGTNLQTVRDALMDLLWAHLHKDHHVAPDFSALVKNARANIRLIGASLPTADPATSGDVGGLGPVHPVNPGGGRSWQETAFGRWQR